MSENKMAEVAKLLGVGLEEEFIGKYRKGDKLRCRIFDNNVWISTTGKEWCVNNYVLRDLITGKCTIHKLPWKAKLHETYFVPTTTYNHKYRETKVMDWTDDVLYNRGLMCRTKEQAIDIADAMIKVARERQGFDENE